MNLQIQKLSLSQLKNYKIIIIMQQNTPCPSNLQPQFPTKNQSIISSIPIKKPRSSTTQCRICLQDNDAMIQPCRCLGSIKYVHESCMMQWIETTMRKKTHSQQEKLKTSGIQCQMCKYLIKFQAGHGSKCRNCQGLKNQFMKRMTLFLLLFLVLIVSLMGIGCIGWVMKSTLGQFKKNSKNTFFYVLAVCGVCLLSVLAILCIYALLTQLFLFNELKVNKISKRFNNQTEQRYFKSRSQIIPIQDQSMNNSLRILGFAPERTNRY